MRANEWLNLNMYTMLTESVSRRRKYEQKANVEFRISFVCIFFLFFGLRLFFNGMQIVFGIKAKCAKKTTTVYF